MMQKLYKFSIIFLVLLLSFSAIATQQDSTNNLLGYLDSMQTFACDFVQHSDQNDQKRYGVLYISKPGKMRIDYNTPKEESIYVLDSMIIHHDKELDEVSYISNDDFAMKFLFEPSSKLIKDPSIKILQVKGSSNSILYFNHDVYNVKLVFDGQHISEITTFTQDSNVTLNISNPEYNSALNKEVFTFRHPKSIE